MFFKFHQFINFIFFFFRISQDDSKEENIGQRTRSKLNLKEKRLEEIEQNFFPPDITSDMYGCEWEEDEEYLEFLNSTYFRDSPVLTEANVIEDDPEQDPEYNFLSDEELNNICKCKLLYILLKIF